MGSSTHRLALAITAAVLILGHATVSAETDTYEEKRAEALQRCRGEYKNKKITSDQLKAVLERHQAWLHDYDTEQKRESGLAIRDQRFANLCGADLSEAYLKGANLSEVNLGGAGLSGASLGRANLSRAHLGGANLSESNLDHANLSEAILAGANLSGAYLWNTNLSGAKLSSTNLSGAYLSGANMSGVELWEANMYGTRFEPNELPLIDTIAVAENLAQTYYSHSPQALIKLRKAFNESGYREEARAITHAINRSEEWRGDSVWDIVEGTFKYVFFNLPTQWGMYPGRALRALVVLIGVFSLPYIVALRYPGSGRIYRKWGSNNTHIVAASPTRSKHRATATTPEGTEPLQYNWAHAILTGLQFSLLSAFHIGFREFNVGNWISRLQSRDYTLYATGWVRSVAGTQALISVYLLAMWALTYFGRPFD